MNDAVIDIFDSFLNSIQPFQVADIALYLRKELKICGHIIVLRYYLIFIKRKENCLNETYKGVVTAKKLICSDSFPIPM